jgi:hypothetical protein
MKLKYLKRSEGSRRRICPPPRTASDRFFEPNEWVLHKVLPRKHVELHHVSSGLVLKLGLDSYREFRDPDWLLFDVLVRIENGNVRIQPAPGGTAERIYEMIVAREVRAQPDQPGRWGRSPSDWNSAALRQLELIWHSEDGENIWPREPPDPNERD